MHNSYLYIYFTENWVYKRNLKEFSLYGGNWDFLDKFLVQALVSISSIKWKFLQIPFIHSIFRKVDT